MTTQRVEVAIGDTYDALTITAAGTLTAGHIVRMEYDDAATTESLYDAIEKLRNKILQNEP